MAAVLMATTSAIPGEQTQPVTKLIESLRGRIRELEVTLRDERLHRITAAGQYEEQIQELAVAIDNSAAQFFRLMQTATVQSAHIEELEAQKRQAQRGQEELQSLRAQLAQKGKQIDLLTEELRNALKRSEDLQQQMVDMTKNHTNQLAKNEETLAEVNKTLKQRVVYQQPTVAGALVGLFGAVVRGFIGAITCQKLR